MPVSNLLTDLTAGNDWTVERTIDLDDTYTITLVELIVRSFYAQSPSDAPVHKTVTTSLTGDGQLTDNAAVSQACSFVINVANTVTALLDPAEMYFYEINLYTSTAKKYTAENGAITPQR